MSLGHDILARWSADQVEKASIQGQALTGPEHGPLLVGGRPHRRDGAGRRGGGAPVRALCFSERVRVLSRARSHWGDGPNGRGSRGRLAVAPGLVGGRQKRRTGAPSAWVHGPQSGGSCGRSRGCSCATVLVRAFSAVRELRRGAGALPHSQPSAIARRRLLVTSTCCDGTFLNSGRRSGCTASWAPAAPCATPASASRRTRGTPARAAA